MFKLKDYQEKALSTLDGFYRKVRMGGLEAAWEEYAPRVEKGEQVFQAQYDKGAFGEIPAVCVRIPTGGGKTFLAAHAVARVGKSFLDTAAPVVLWLVPSDAIRSQTLAALNTPRNPCREALTHHFGELVRVCALEDLATVGPQEVGLSAIIIVATIQSFNVKEKSIRTVYDFDEVLEPHFQTLTPQQKSRLECVTEADIAKQKYLTAADVGRVKTSLANWLSLNQPIVVVDEAHNNRTEQAFRTLRNLSPACLIEMTATPVNGSNVLFHVGAQALAREDMIKLPIVLMPQLCLNWDGEVQPIEKRLLSELGEFDLFAEPVRLENFSIFENGKTFEIDVEGGKVVYELADSGQLHLNEVVAHASENDLVRWLDKECRQQDVGQAILLKWLLAVVRNLMVERGFSLTALLRAKYLLAEAVRREIERRRSGAIMTGFQKSLEGFFVAPKLEDGFRYSFTFLPNHYPARPPFYSGRYKFKKHYYPVIHELREKRADGTPAEEFVCAQAIDQNSMVKHWVRNVQKEEKYSFWLPTSSDYFYPDFVCELKDGRLLVVEYKGGHLDNSSTDEKAQVGYQWEKSSDGRCLFLMAWAQDELGRDVGQQIAAKIVQKG